MASTSTSADKELEELSEKAFDTAGVDLTQIDIMLALSPRQRLAMLYETAESLARLARHADTD